MVTTHVYIIVFLVWGWGGAAADDDENDDGIGNKLYRR